MVPMVAVHSVREMKLLFVSLAACLITPSWASGGHLPPAPPPPSFGFSPVLGDYMVLQQSPAAAAVYGAVPESATGVTVTVTSSDGKSSYSVVAKVGKDATHQPNGYVDPSGANLPVHNFTWKAVLHPTAAGGDYSIMAKCTGCTNTTTATLAHVTFGDMWYCSGQSNSKTTANPGTVALCLLTVLLVHVACAAFCVWQCGCLCSTVSRATKQWQLSTLESTRTSAAYSVPQPLPPPPASGRQRSRRSRTATRLLPAIACSTWALSAGILPRSWLSVA
eukprot:COSAG02_NODE_4471_length_5328_cov_3.132721_7_plen_278_part_00